MVQGEKYSWVVPFCDSQITTQILEMSKLYNLSLPICQTLFVRGFNTKEQIDSFLFNFYEKDISHASLMKDAIKAVDRIVKAIKNNEKILVFGDYDVDGITSSAMMMLCMSGLKANINFFLPHRVNDGYGLSSKIVKKAAQNGYKLIITVDNGITAFEPAQEAKKFGIDLIITDHHRPHELLPDAFAIVNPNQRDCHYPFKHLAGVGVTFKLMSLLYEKFNIKLPEKSYELLLLGTIADVVPLIGENRFWVRYGLQYINKIESISFKVLKQNGKLNKSKISSLDIGFNITPQINALGRLEDPRQGVKFLIGIDEQEVNLVGNILWQLNNVRKEIEKSIFNEVNNEIKSDRINLKEENIILAASTKWMPGVIGLVASRLVAEYNRPTLLFHITKDGIAKGSCRSISGFNFFDALKKANHLIDKFGGHSAAAGLSLKVENLPALKNILEEIIFEQLKVEDLKKKLSIDAELKLSDLDSKFMSDLEQLEPFGNSNDRPLFFVKEVIIVQRPILMKDAHVKCHVFANGVIKPVVFFNKPDLFDKFIKQEDKPFSLAVQVVENSWNGNSTIELLGLDVSFG